MKRLKGLAVVIMAVIMGLSCFMLSACDKVPGGESGSVSSTDSVGGSSVAPGTSVGPNENEEPSAEANAVSILSSIGEFLGGMTITIEGNVYDFSDEEIIVNEELYPSVTEADYLTKLDLKANIDFANTASGFKFRILSTNKDSSKEGKAPITYTSEFLYNGGDVIDCVDSDDSGDADSAPDYSTISTIENFGFAKTDEKGHTIYDKKGNAVLNTETITEIDATFTQVFATIAEAKPAVTAALAELKLGLTAEDFTAVVSYAANAYKSIVSTIGGTSELVVPAITGNPAKILAKFIAFEKQTDGTYLAAFDIQDVITIIKAVITEVGKMGNMTIANCIDAVIGEGQTAKIIATLSAIKGTDKMSAVVEQVIGALSAAGIKEDELYTMAAEIMNKASGAAVGSETYMTAENVKKMFMEEIIGENTVDEFIEMIMAMISGEGKVDGGEGEGVEPAPSMWATIVETISSYSQMTLDDVVDMVAGMFDNEYKAGTLSLASVTAMANDLIGVYTKDLVFNASIKADANSKATALELNMGYKLSSIDGGYGSTTVTADKEIINPTKIKRSIDYSFSVKVVKNSDCDFTMSKTMQDAKTAEETPKAV